MIEKKINHWSLIAMWRRHRSEVRDDWQECMTYYTICYTCPTPTQVLKTLKHFGLEDISITYLLQYHKTHNLNFPSGWLAPIAGKSNIMFDSFTVFYHQCHSKEPISPYFSRCIPGAMKDQQILKDHWTHTMTLEQAHSRLMSWRLTMTSLRIVLLPAVYL